MLLLVPERSMTLRPKCQAAATLNRDFFFCDSCPGQYCSALGLALQTGFVLIRSSSTCFPSKDMQSTMWYARPTIMRHNAVRAIQEVVALVQACFVSFQWLRKPLVWVDGQSDITEANCVTRDAVAVPGVVCRLVQYVLLLLTRLIKKIFDTTRGNMWLTFYIMLWSNAMKAGKPVEHKTQ